MLTRRNFLAGTALSGGALLAHPVRHAIGLPFETALPIPRLIDATSSRKVSLIAARGMHAYQRGQMTVSYGYSAPVLGPAVRVASGQSTEFVVENRTENPTTVHWHGLVIPSETDGGPHNQIAVGGTWKVNLRVDQPESTAWFHPHLHNDTARQVYSGLAGLIFIEDGSAERLGLPRTYGSDDIPLILQDRRLSRVGVPLYDPTPMDTMSGFRGETVIVNGVAAPYARVPAGIVRLRLLNSANARLFDLAFSDQRTFHVVASDGGYLAGPVATRRLIVAPGERYEVLVDFSSGGDVVLETGPDNNVPMMGMMRGSSAIASSGAVVKFVIDRNIPAAVRTVPQRLASIAQPEPDRSMVRRRFVLNDMMMGGMGGGGLRRGPVMAINGRPFDMERIDAQTKLGSTEIWEIVSQSMAHPFHVHGTQFRILTMNGRAPPPHLQGLKDTVLVEREAQILVPLSQPTTPSHPFMFHCHILEHEDAGMMGQFTCV